MTQYFVIMEIALFDPAIFKGDFAVQCQRQPHDGAALKLGADAFRVDLRAAINGCIDRQYMHVTLVIDMNFDDGSGIAHEAVAERQPQAMAIG